MQRLGFYLCGQQPVERVLPLIAKAAKGQGERLLVVADDADLLARLDKALWDVAPEHFLAHGMAGAAHSERQPVLLSDRCEAANGGAIAALADGRWREDAERFERVLLFFDDAGREAARAIWRRFDTRDDLAREFFALDGGKWVKRA